MKKGPPIKDSIFSLFKIQRFKVVLSCVGLVFATQTLQAIQTTPAWGSSDLDRQYSFESIGYLRSWDNVDGLFAEYVAAAYKEYFSHQSRFIVNDLTQMDSVLGRAKIPYQRVIQDPEILRQIARSTRTSTLLRTEIKKVGSQYLFKLAWLKAPQMEEISKLDFSLEEPVDGTPIGGNFIAPSLQLNVQRLFSQVPFLGYITGKDNQSLTVNIGSFEKITPGDILLVSTLDEVKKHTLLKTIVDWKLSATGKLVVEQVEEGMAFCKILEEEPGATILKYQKIVQIQKPSPKSQETFPPLSEEADLFSPSQSPPTLGFVALKLSAGSASRQFTSSGSNTNSGGGFALGSGAEGQIWLTRQWFLDLGLGYSSWNFTQQNTTTAIQTPASSNGGVSASSVSAKINVGYAYLLKNDPMGPKGWAKLGYKSTSYSLPTSTLELTGPVSFGTVFLGIGGSSPVWNNWGILTNLNLKVLTSTTQSWVNETVDSSSDFEFFLGGYYRLNPRMSIRGGLEIIANGVDFSKGSSLSQKTMTFAPALLYYF